MNSRSRPVAFAAILGLLGAARCLAQEQNVPLANWTVPQYSLTGLGKAVDATPPRAFIGLPPCRVIDTRGGAPLGGGIFANSEARNFTVTGLCGIPGGTDAISANFTVTGSPAAPPGAFILAYPTGSPPSPVVSLLNFQAGQTIANAGIVPLDGSGRITINVSHSTHVIMDVNGYFSDTLGTPGNFFELTNNSSSYSIFVSNGSTTCSATCGISASIASTGSQAYAITGNANGGTGVNYGVLGRTSSTSDGAAGVTGEDGSAPVVGSNLNVSAGVKGLSSTGTGVLGMVDDGVGEGITGRMNDPTTGAVLSAGYLGYASNIGVYFINGLSGSGTKNFVEPHPTDASKLIKYVSLEGNEAGTYFRGRGKFERGLARIPVPEDFRIVTDAEGLSIQITPIGDMASVAVVRIDLNEIVVKGSRNVEFFYTVNGVRRAYKTWNPVWPNEKEFVPESADAKLPAYLSEDERSRLIQNGTYNPDGTVNLLTAQKLGWDKKWPGKGSKTEPESKSPTPEK